MEHHTRFDFSDRDLVLSVPETADATLLLRIHRLFLSYHLQVFADMLSLPASSASETYDGITIVRMHDNPEDLTRKLIAAMCDPKCVQPMP